MSGMSAISGSGYNNWLNTEPVEKNKPGTELEAHKHSVAEFMGKNMRECNAQPMSEGLLHAFQHGSDDVLKYMDEHDLAFLTILYSDSEGKVKEVKTLSRIDGKPIANTTSNEQAASYSFDLSACSLAAFYDEFHVMQWQQDGTIPAVCVKNSDGITFATESPTPAPTHGDEIWQRYQQSDKQAVEKSIEEFLGKSKGDIKAKTELLPDELSEILNNRKGENIVRYMRENKISAFSLMYPDDKGNIVNLITVFENKEGDYFYQNAYLGAENITGRAFDVESLGNDELQRFFEVSRFTGDTAPLYVQSKK